MSDRSPARNLNDVRVRYDASDCTVSYRNSPTKRNDNANDTFSG